METDRPECGDACAPLGRAPREAGDGLSQSPAFPERDALKRDGNYISRASALSPSLVNDSNQEYKLTKDEFEFTKDYLNKEFRRYQQPNVDVNDIYKQIDSERLRLSTSETERLKRSLFGEEPIPTPEYLLKNSEFLQRSNDILSRLARERDRKDAESRLLADYREILRDYGDDVPLKTGRDRYDGKVASEDEDRYRGHDKNYSTSEDEGVRTAEDIAAYSKGIHRLLTGYAVERQVSSDTEGEAPERPQLPSEDSPTMYHHPLQHSPNLNLRQSSPYPAESVNQGGKHKPQHYSHKKTSLRNNEKNEKNSHRDGLGSREHSSGTLPSRGRISNRRHTQSNGLPSSSSNSSISDNADTYHDVDPRARIGLENDLNVDSPPEPAPPEVPPRGPSLHHPGGGHTLGRSGRNGPQDRQDIFLSQEKDGEEN